MPYADVSVERKNGLSYLGCLSTGHDTGGAASHGNEERGAQPLCRAVIDGGLMGSQAGKCMLVALVDGDRSLVSVLI